MHVFFVRHTEKTKQNKNSQKTKLEKISSYFERRLKTIFFVVICRVTFQPQLCCLIINYGKPQPLYTIGRGFATYS